MKIILVVSIALTFQKIHIRFLMTKKIQCLQLVLNDVMDSCTRSVYNFIITLFFDQTR
jgi:hypothetical protein